MLCAAAPWRCPAARMKFSLAPLFRFGLSGPNTSIHLRHAASINENYEKSDIRTHPVKRCQTIGPTFRTSQGIGAGNALPGGLPAYQMSKIRRSNHKMWDASAVNPTASLLKQVVRTCSLH